jgi:hypothetical protein
MRIIKIIFLFIAIISLTSCASGYKIIEPKTVNYISTNEKNGVKLKYKYDLLNKKYSEKEVKKGVKIVAVKLTNNSDQDLMFGREIKLTYENGNEIFIMDNDKVFSSLKQKPAFHLFYLLLTPVNLNIINSNGSSSSIPIGLGLGPLLAGMNMVKASLANKKFKNEILESDMNGTLIKKGETKYGLIGIKADTFDSLILKIEESPLVTTANRKKGQLSKK